MRYFIEFSYCGTNYHGWQTQPNAVTVQSVLNKALSMILNSNINCLGAGRTDTGVHAMHMVAHFDTLKDFDLASLISKLNSFLPKDISISSLRSVKSEAHARFDALNRTYIYRISMVKNVFEIDKSFYFSQLLDLSLMNQACEALIGKKDFKCFSKTGSDVKNYLCEITYAKWIKKGDLIEFKITSNRFLRNMVRAIVGTLLDIGLKKTSLIEFKNIIKSKDRTKAGASAPAEGLYLTSIKYPISIYNDVKH